MGEATTEQHLVRFCKKLEVTPTNINADIVRRAREKAQTEMTVFDVNVAAVATVWLVFYCVSIAHAFTNQLFAAAVELSAAY